MIKRTSMDSSYLSLLRMQANLLSLDSLRRTLSLWDKAIEFPVKIISNSNRYNHCVKTITSNHRFAHSWVFLRIHRCEIFKLVSSKWVLLAIWTSAALRLRWLQNQPSNKRYQNILSKIDLERNHKQHASSIAANN